MLKIKKKLKKQTKIRGKSVSLTIKLQKNCSKSKK